MITQNPICIYGLSGIMYINKVYINIKMHVRLQRIVLERPDLGGRYLDVTGPVKWQIKMLISNKHPFIYSGNGTNVYKSKLNPMKETEVARHPRYV